MSVPFYSLLSSSLLGVVLASGPKARKPIVMKVEMEHLYPFPWKTVTDFVLQEKRKGAPDPNVTLHLMDDTIFRYHIQMPWYARLLGLGGVIIWEDRIHIDEDKQMLNEVGQNISVREKGVVTDTSYWCASGADKDKTQYKKCVDIVLYNRWAPDLVQKVAEGLLRWFRGKSMESRNIEEAAILRHVRELEREQAVKGPGTGT